MKTIVLGDIHGRSAWADILKAEQPDRVIFLGDYMDSFDVKPEDQIENLYKILDVKNAIRCIGNHDFHYLTNDNDERYSGFNLSIKRIIQPILKEAVEENKIVPLFVEDKIIYSHAGVSKFWLTNISNVNKVEDINNETFDYDTLRFNYLKGYNPYGDTLSQGPIWIRPASLFKDQLDGYIQIVGHTPTRKIIQEGNLFLCDCLEHGDGEYLQIIDGCIKINRQQ